MKAGESTYWRSRAYARSTKLVRWLFKLRGSPEAVALGVAIGTFVAFTPTIGFQIVIAAALATLLGANRPGAIVAVAITNPATIPAVFALTYWIGSCFWPGPPVRHVYDMLSMFASNVGNHEFWQMTGQLDAFMALGRDLFVPLWIGGLILGSASGAATYALALHLIRRYRARRSRGPRKRHPHGERARPNRGS